VDGGTAEQDWMNDHQSPETLNGTLLREREPVPPVVS
jgi:hypothetical protein